MSETTPLPHDNPNDPTSNATTNDVCDGEEPDQIEPTEVEGGVVNDTQQDAGDSVESLEDDMPKKKRRVTKYTNISRVKFNGNLERKDDVFVAMLDNPLYILSPTVTIMSDLYDDDGEYSKYVSLKLKKTHLHVFKNLEDDLLSMAKTHKATWFGNPDIPDEFLEKSIKRFINTDDKTLMVKIDDALGGKKNVSVGTRVKVVLSAECAIFTRTQFGVPFTLHLIKSIENTEDVYLFDPEEDESHKTIASYSLMDHLENEGSSLVDEL
jgi:hypothetical protein